MVSLHTGLKPKAAPRALRSPRPLEVFAREAERYTGQAVKVLLFEVPYQAEEVSPFQSSNPYLAIFSFFDMVYIFQLVLGLLAILIASETISGEKEDGTLRLVLTTNVSRAQILAGKVLAGLTTLAIPTALGFILLTILLLVTEHIEVGGGEWARMGLLFALSLLYLLVFYLIGLAFSCTTHRSATSLIYALFTWALLAIVLPNSISALFNEQANMGEKHTQVHHKAAQVWKEFDQEVLNLARAHGQTRYYPTDMVERAQARSAVTYDDGTGAYSIRDGQKRYIPNLYLSNVADSPQLAKFQDIVRTGERLRLKYAQRAWNEKAPSLKAFPAASNDGTLNSNASCPPGPMLKPLVPSPAPADANTTTSLTKCAPIAGRSSPFSKTAMRLVRVSGSTTIPAGAPTCATCRDFTRATRPSPRA